MRNYRLLVLVCALFLTSLSLYAQANPTFISADGTVSFSSLPAWEVLDRGDGFISIAGADFAATVFTPQALAGQELAAETDPARLIVALAQSRGYLPGELTVFASNGQPAARLAYTSTESPAGFLLGFVVGEQRIAFDVTTTGDSRLIQRDIEVVMTGFTYTESAEPPSSFVQFSAAEDNLTFEYPRGWQVVDNGDDTLAVTGSAFNATLYTPDALTQFTDLDDPARLVSAALEQAQYTPGQFSIFLSSRRPAARFDYTTAGGDAGYFLAFTLESGALILVDVQPADATSAAIVQKDIELLISTLTTDAAPVVVATPAPKPTPGIVTFTSKDGTITLTHASDWFVGEDDTGKIYGYLGDPAVSMTLYPPEALINQRYLMNGEPPEQFLARYRSNFGLNMGAIEDVTIGEQPAARRPVSLQSGGEFLAIQLPGGAYILVEGFMFAGDWTPDAQKRLYEVAETIAYMGAVVADESLDAPPIPALTNHAGGWRDATQELEDFQLIPFGGKFLYEETYLFFKGAGQAPVRLSTLAASNNVVMGGTMTYTPGGDKVRAGDYCALGVRRSVETGRPGALRFGLTSDGLVFYEDESREPDAPLRTESARLNGTLTDPHTFIIIATDDRMTLFVDGQPVFVEVEVEDRSGIYALLPRSTERTSSCEARNIWVFTLPDVITPGVCEIQTVGQVNKRGGAGTNFNVVGELPGFSSVPVVGQTIGTDGFRWWELEDGSFVRGDIVNIAGDCSQFVQPENTEPTPTPLGEGS